MRAALLGYFCRTSETDCSWLIYLFFFVSIICLIGSPFVMYHSFKDYWYSKKNKKSDFKQKKKEMIYFCFFGGPIMFCAGYYFFFELFDKIF